MHGEVEGASLLSIAQNELQEFVIPHLAGQERYRALLIANAMRVVARELAQSVAQQAATAATLSAAGAAVGVQYSHDRDLIAALRSGSFLENVDLHHALWAQAVVGVSVTKPSALSRIERRMAGVDDL